MPYKRGWIDRATAALERRVDRSGDGCWPWTGSMVGLGYGKLKVDGEQWLAHRLAWVLANGRGVPDGEVVRHSCDNAACCRPDHLIAGSSAENAQDAAVKHRTVDRRAGKIGHVRERSPGRWELRIYAGRDVLTGRKKMATKTVPASSEREATLALLEWAGELRTSPISADMTVGELLDRYFELASPYMVPAGQRETRWIIDRRLEPLHEVKLERLAGRTGPAVLDTFYAALRERGGLCRARKAKCEHMPCPHGGGDPLSDATVVRAHVVVSAALAQAVKWGLIGRNPAELAFAGEPDAEEVKPPRPEEVRELFRLAEELDPELVVLLVLGSTTGQRKGRLLGLWWEDLDLEVGLAAFGHVVSIGPAGPERVRVSRSKRSHKGKATIVPLDPSVVAILLAHRERCRARCAALGVELDPRSFVFAGDPVGDTALNPRTLSRHFAALRTKAGLEEGRLHDLRHFVVSYLVDAGVKLETVKALVGHAAASRTTEDVYTHEVSMGPKREAVGILARLLGLPIPEGPENDPAPENVVVPLRRRTPA